MITAMPDHDEAPKTALEIAMARLKEKDAASGEPQHALTDAQKAQIAEARQAGQATLAQEDILYQSALAQTWDPEARATLEQNHRRDVQRIQGDMESKIAKIRRA
jgi:hypothetical protein